MSRSSIGNLSYTIISGIIIALPIVGIVGWLCTIFILGFISGPSFTFDVWITYMLVTVPLTSIILSVIVQSRLTQVGYRTHYLVNFSLSVLTIASILNIYGFNMMNRRNNVEVSSSLLLLICISFYFFVIKLFSTRNSKFDNINKKYKVQRSSPTKKEFNITIGSNSSTKKE